MCPSRNRGDGAGGSWEGDPTARILTRIRALGYASFGDFLNAYPCVPYANLADLLGTSDVAAVQLEHIHSTLPSSAPERDFAQRDSLSRYLCEALQKGWKAGRYWESRVLGSLANWIVMWGQEPWLRRVFGELSGVAPIGWVPSGPDDPVLREAIDRARR